MNLYNNQNNISYDLICFIELMTNIVYYKDNNNIWNKYLGNQFEQVKNIEDIKPKILFYILNSNIQNNLINIDYQKMMNINQFNNNCINNMNDNRNNFNNFINYFKLF